MDHSFLLESALNAAYNGILIIDKNFRIVFCNEAASKLIGLPKEQIIYQNITEVSPDSKEIDEVLTEGKQHLNKKVVLGSRVVISNRSPIFRDGEVAGAVTVFQDITDFQEISNELGDTKDALQRLETGLEHVSDGIVMVDDKSYITMITESYCNFLGTTIEEAKGKHIAEVIENTRMHHVIQTGKAELGQVQHIDGKQVVVNRIPIIIDNKVVGGVGQVIFQEVSDLLKLVRRLNLVESKLEYYQQEVKRHKRVRYSLDNIIGKSDRMNQMKKMIKKLLNILQRYWCAGKVVPGKNL